MENFDIRDKDQFCEVCLFKKLLDFLAWIVAATIG